MRVWNRFNRAKDAHLRTNGFGIWDEERWTKPCRQGAFLKRKQKNEMKKNASYWLSFMLEGISGASVRGAQWSPLVSQTQRGPTVGSLLATLMMRRSCSLLPCRDFPLWSFFVSFSFCHHHEIHQVTEYMWADTVACVHKKRNISAEINPKRAIQ